MVEPGKGRIGLGVTLALVVGGCLLQILLVPHEVEGVSTDAGKPHAMRQAMMPRIASAIAPPSDMKAPSPTPIVRQEAPAATARIADPPDPVSLQPAGRLQVTGPSEAIVGDLVTFSVVALDARGAVYAPLVLRHDPSALGFVSAEEGDLFSSDGARTQFIAAPSGLSGLIEIAVSRVPPAAGVEAGGVLASATFLVLADGESRIGIEGSRLIDPIGVEIPFDSEEAVFLARKPGSGIEGKLE